MHDRTPSHTASGDGRTAPEATSVLLGRYRDGDQAAADALLRRYDPVLRAWARGRLPVKARALADTDDLVQVVLLRAMRNLDRFEWRREGSFLAYLRTSYLNAVREELRRHHRRPEHDELHDELPDDTDSSLDHVFADYERALLQLPVHTREAVMLRVEFGYSFEEIARAVGSPSANAARMQVARALVDLAAMMEDDPSIESVSDRPSGPDEGGRR